MPEKGYCAVFILLKELGVDFQCVVEEGCLWVARNCAIG